MTLCREREGVKRVAGKRIGIPQPHKPENQEQCHGRLCMGISTVPVWRCFEGNLPAVETPGFGEVP